jgi:hypothetical protein
MPKECIAEKFLLQEKVYLEWARKKIIFSEMRVSRNLSHLLILLLQVPLLICIKFTKKNHHLFAAISKADISGHVIVWLELMGVQDKEVRICQTGSMISLKGCLSGD